MSEIRPKRSQCDVLEHHVSTTRCAELDRQHLERQTLVLVRTDRRRPPVVVTRGPTATRRAPPSTTTASSSSRTESTPPYIHSVRMCPCTIASASTTGPTTMSNSPFRPPAPGSRHIGNKLCITNRDHSYSFCQAFARKNRREQVTPMANLHGSSASTSLATSAYPKARRYSAAQVPRLHG